MQEFDRMKEPFEARNSIDVYKSEGELRRSGRNLSRR
jgi:hypothetical protein